MGTMNYFAGKLLRETSEPMKIAILDDYQNVTLKCQIGRPFQGGQRSLFLTTTFEIHPLLSTGFCPMTSFA